MSDEALEIDWHEGRPDEDFGERFNDLEDEPAPSPPSPNQIGE